MRFWVKMLKLWLYPKTSEDVQLRVKHDVTAKTTIFVSFNPQADNFVNIEKKLEKYLKKIHYQTLTKNYNKKLKKKRWMLRYGFFWIRIANFLIILEIKILIFFLTAEIKPLRYLKCSFWFRFHWELWLAHRQNFRFWSDL